MNWALLHKYLLGECTPIEKKKVEDWLKEDKSNQHLFDSLSKVWSVEPADNFDVNAKEAWKEFRKKIKTETSVESSSIIDNLQELSDRREKYSRPLALSIAAGVAMITFISVYLFMSGTFTIDQTDVRADQVQEVTTKPGQRTSFQLADGSKVSLNSDSNIRISPEFGDSLRKVYLEGEAYFEVASNPDIPFEVHSGHSYTQVLGTKFGVKAYPDDQNIQVVVEEGEVMLGTANKDSEKEKKLTENTLGILDSDGTSQVFHIGKTTKYLAWKNGRLMFDSTPFREVIPRLERWYNIKITADSSLSSQKVTATFKDEPMVEVLNILAISLDARLGQENRKINFKSKQQ
jgi:ferric-dicitrate binding protein FerR (iron transport regulator)